MLKVVFLAVMQWCWHLPDNFNWFWVSLMVPVSCRLFCHLLDTCLSCFHLFRLSRLISFSHFCTCVFFHQLYPVSLTDCFPDDISKDNFSTFLSSNLVAECSHFFSILNFLLLSSQYNLNLHFKVIGYNLSSSQLQLFFGSMWWGGRMAVREKEVNGPMKRPNSDK